MPVINTFVAEMLQHKKQTILSFGKDKTNTIEYRFNQQGFRSDIDYVQPPTYAFFGCSLVFGVGVAQEKTFTSYFNNAYNYGLATQYNNNDILNLILEFSKSPLYTSNTKMAVFWTNRDSDRLPDQIKKLQHLQITQFFCGNVILDNGFKMVKNIDEDVSGTHIGPKTHHLMYKILCNLL